MDAKEKNRETDRRRRAPQDQRRQRPAAQADPRKKKTAEKKTDKNAPRSAAAPEAARPRQRSAAAPESDRPRQRREQPAGPAKRGTERAAAPARRSSRPEDIPVSVPRGTGPRKSAPQPTAEEVAALRRQQRSQRPQRQQTAQKKNALQNFISGVRSDEKTADDPAAKSEKRRAERAARAERKQKQIRRYDTPAVIYTEPQVFNRDRLLIQLLTVTAVVAALVLGMSVFFKVKTITVAGADTYSEYSVQQASGISEGDNLLTFSRAKAAAKIQAELSYVDDIRIGIKLPDTVIIYIEEMDVAYAVESTQGDWWLINSEGRVVEQLDAGQNGNYTQLLGVLLEDPQVGNAAVAADEVPQETLASGEPVPLSVTGAQRLSSALQILKALEANDIVGQAASVDVSALDDVTLWYGSRYEVLLGDTTRMEYKIACMNDAILQMSDYQSGILDISFTHRQDQVVYTPFG
ncbi:MAG: FtsQ-type POTRA domain-containing protein [Faecousia sp.]